MESKLIIKYYTKNVYGNELMYLLDEEQATAVWMLTGKQTINSQDMQALIMLTDCVFEEVLPPKK